MDRRVLHLTSTAAGLRARMALAARMRQAEHSLNIAPKDQPETIMVVSFEGLTEREQEAALASFPGGKRFVLQA